MKKIKELRTSLSLTQEKLAEAVDLSVNYISEIESGKKRPSLKSLEKIASVLNVSVSALMDDAEQPRPTCPFFASANEGAVADTFDVVTREIIQMFADMSLEDRIKILNYTRDIKQLSDLRGKTSICGQSVKSC